MERPKVPHTSRSRSCFYLEALYQHDQIREKAQTQAVRQARCQDSFFHFPYGNLCFGLYPGRHKVWDEDIFVETLVQ